MKWNWAQKSPEKLYVDATLQDIRWTTAQYSYLSAAFLWHMGQHRSAGREEQQPQVCFLFLHRDPSRRWKGYSNLDSSGPDQMLQEAKQRRGANFLTAHQDCF